MSGKVVNTLVMCGDSRLRGVGDELIEEHIKSDPYRWMRPGGVLELLREKTCSPFICNISTGTNGCEKWNIFLMNHQDCKAYPKWFSGDPAVEKSSHISDLRKAREMIMAVFVKANIKMFFAKILPGTEDKFALEEIHPF